MNIALITGSAGLVGSETVEFISNKFDLVVGIDNDMRAEFFGQEASNQWNKNRLLQKIKNYRHHDVDIRDKASLEKIFVEIGNDIGLIVHTAAQPSHDFAAKDAFKDFTINANGTLILLEMTRQYAPKAVFIFTSTNKVYGEMEDG